MIGHILLPIWTTLIGAAIGALWSRWRERDRLRREIVRLYTRPPMSTGIPTLTEMPEPDWDKLL